MKILPSPEFRRGLPLLLAVALALLGALWWAPPALAQGEDWRERPAINFNILYTAGNEAEAERYAGFVDTIYEEVATLFGHRTQTPITLRLFPTLESYYQVNPLARNIPGVVAHADFRRREVVVLIPQTASQTPTEVENNIRHELTHIVAADLSANRLNTGLQEGIAQYLEHPSPDLDAKIEALRRSREAGALLSWSDFDERDKVYGDPQAAYPQALSAVAFLIERNGFSTFREFLTISARSSGYRSALERAYGVSPAALEQEWLDWLPGYIAGGYRRNALTSYDLGYPRQLLAQGRYAEAQAELDQAISWLQKNAETQPPEIMAEAEALRMRSQDGQRAERMTAAARTALDRGEYDEAGKLIAQARDLFTALDDTRQDAVLSAYAERVNRARSASEQLAAARALAQQLRFPQARTAADIAAAEFAAIGDNIRMNSALALRQTLDSRQRLLGAVLVGIGVLGVLLSLWGTWNRREAEVW